ncbi:MAG: nucleoside-diphosphate kinase [Methanobrevibacter sp.]|jgi:nucleoside-diphosphate kinase|nr:nucleoside-diphosphate kinase [Candidatus Methanovirga basalitermitum]
MIERSFVILKPDAVSRKLIGKIISRFEEKGLKIVGTKFLQVTKDLAETHYGEHEGKPFFNNLVSYIISAPSLAMVIEGDDAISVIRKIVGATNPKEADLGTIRGDYGMVTGRNIIHASDSLKSSEREINLFFNKDEVFYYKVPDNSWIYE